MPEPTILILGSGRKSCVSLFHACDAFHDAFHLAEGELVKFAPPLLEGFKRYRRIFARKAGCDALTRRLLLLAHGTATDITALFNPFFIG